MDKLLTIIIPAYNVGKYLRKGLQSILVKSGERLRLLDVIVVNDGSKDETSAIAHEFADRYPGVFAVVDKSNGNYGSCVNVGLQKACGTFVRLQDGDDSFDTDGLSSLVEFLSTVEDDVDLVLCDYNHVNENGVRTGTKDYRYPEDRAFTLGPQFYGQRRIDMLMTTYRREIFERFEYHQTEGVSYTDSEWITYPMAFVRKVRYIPVVVGLYLQGREGQTMAAQTYAARFGQVVDIVKGLVVAHARIVANPLAVSREYFTHLVAYMLNMIYYATIYGVAPNTFPSVDLRELDDFLRKTDESVYRATDRFHVMTRYFHPRLMHAYRRFYSTHDPVICLHRLYVYLYCTAAKLLRR